MSEFSESFDEGRYIGDGDDMYNELVPIGNNGVDDTPLSGYEGPEDCGEFNTFEAVPDILPEHVSAEIIDAPETVAQPRDQFRSSTENPFKLYGDVLVHRRYATASDLVQRWEQIRAVSPDDRSYGGFYVGYYDLVMSEGSGVPDAEIMGKLRRDLHEHEPRAGILNFTDEEVIERVRNRAQTIVPECERRDPELQSYVERFKERLIHAVTEQHLPVDLNVALQKIDNVQVMFVDPYTGVGLFEPECGVVRVGLTDNVRLLREVVAHELTHAVSGYEVLINDTREEPLEQVRLTRVGLHQFEVDKIHLRWMNETVAEKLACLLLYANDIDYRTITVNGLFRREYLNLAYGQTEPLLRELMTGPYGDVRFSTVVGALTEDYDPTLPEGSRVPLQKRLYQEIDAAWGGMQHVQPLLYGRWEQGIEQYDPLAIAAAASGFSALRDASRGI